MWRHRQTHIHTRSSLHMVDYLQTAFYCIELDAEQGVTVSKCSLMTCFSHNRDFFCQMIFSECCDLFEICIWMFSSAIWQSSESWPSVARSNASTSIWQWHLGKVFILNHPRQKYVYIKNWKKVYLFVSWLFDLFFWWTFYQICWLKCICDLFSSFWDNV